MERKKQIIYELACEFGHERHSTPDEIDYKFWEDVQPKDIANALAERIVILETEVESNNQMFDLFHMATLKGTELYRQMHPEYPPLRLPDTTSMIESLCNRIMDLEKLSKLKEENIEILKQIIDTMKKEKDVPF